MPDRSSTQLLACRIMSASWRARCHTDPMTERTRVDQLQPGTTFQLLADWRVEGTDERVPTTDTLTAFEVTVDGSVVQIQTEVGTLGFDNEDFVVVVAEPS